ncbi:STAS domain-containing protein [Planctomycetes bacterium K23_9]|uniref:STAS domain protein n=1 Tax=Stieleria marina TaxID=1930275 RepID=A0A517NSA8_9BACT|nr:STAS domain protein [Planctomycetes bacterium K23_9]
MPIVKRQGSVTVLRPDGPLREENLEIIDEDVSPYLNGGVPYVVIDLTDAPLIDGAGLEWILDLDETCCRRGGCVRLCNVGELCQDLLRITAVGASVQQFPDLTAALGSFA